MDWLLTPEEIEEAFADPATRSRIEADIFATNLLLRPRTCGSCGAKTDAHGELPCGH